MLRRNMSPLTLLFIRGYNKEIIKALHFWSSCWDSTGPSGFPHNGSVMRKCFHIMTSSCTWYKHGVKYDLHDISYGRIKIVVVDGLVSDLLLSSNVSNEFPSQL